MGERSNNGNEGDKTFKLAKDQINRSYVKNGITIGVVVPVFNTINYIDRCVRSLLDQDMDWFTIVLVDDGSTDGSDKLCDKYAEKYENIAVLHKKNGGLSSARNEGVKHLDTEYIVFVDSDDYVSKTYISDLVKGINNADMSIVRIRSVDEHSSYKRPDNGNNYVRVLNSEQAIGYMCYRKYFGFSACGKLFKREHLLKHPFPIGRLHEDMYTTYRLIDECNQVAYVNKSDYFYVQHYGEGITRSHYSEKNMDAVKAAQDINNFISLKYPDIKSAGYAALAYAYWLVTKTLTGNDIENRKVYKSIKKPLYNLLFDKKLAFDHNVSLKNRLQFMVTSLGYFPMVIGWKLYYVAMKWRR